MKTTDAITVILQWLARRRNDFARLGNTGDTIYVELNDDVHRTAKTLEELAKELCKELEIGDKSPDSPQCCGVPMVVISTSFKGVRYGCQTCRKTQWCGDDD